MKKLIIVLAMMAALSACGKKQDSQYTVQQYSTYDNIEFTVRCLGGVEYYVHVGKTNTTSSFGLMAPKINRQTRQPSLCQ